MKNEVSDYGWNNERQPNSCGYITPVIIKLLSSLLPRSRICDIGSGNGALVADLNRRGYSAVGVEYDAQGIDISKRSYPQFSFYRLGVQDEPTTLVAEQGLFDIAISTEVIEHLYSPHLLPQFAYKILRTDGLLIISTPYHGYLKNLVMGILGCWDRHFTALWHGGHIKFFSRRSLTTLLENNGFRVLSFHGAGRLPYLWKSMVVVAVRRPGITDAL